MQRISDSFFSVKVLPEALDEIPVIVFDDFKRELRLVVVVD